MDVKKRAKIFNARRVNKMRWIAGAVLSALVVVFAVVTILLSVSVLYDEAAKSEGLSTFRMFTTLSNVIAAIAAFMCLPFQIDGLKRDHYKLPSWIVILLYVGAVGTFLTFFVAITILSFARGFVPIMLTGTNLFLHTINPILISFLMAYVISDVKISFRASLFSLIPIALYCLLYFVMVFALGLWNDVYQANAYIPWPVTMVLILSLAFGLSQLLRFLHNLRQRHVSETISRYYLESPDYEFPRVSDAVAFLAESRSKYYYEGDDIDIPTDVIALLQQRYGASIVPLDILYDIYLESYLRNIKKSGQPKG